MSILVYSTADGRGRLISFEDRVPRAWPLVLVATFLDDEEADAWELLHELGEQPDVA